MTDGGIYTVQIHFITNFSDVFTSGHCQNSPHYKTKACYIATQHSFSKYVDSHCPEKI